MNRFRIAALLMALVAPDSLLPARAQSGDSTRAMRDAMSALARGDFSAAERTLRVEVAARPDDVWALSLLGASLDSLKRIAEADPFHRRAVAAAPRSADVLNNFAAHLWLAGEEAEAGKIYERIVAIDPAHTNANLQLARLALKAGNAPETLRCLDRLPFTERDEPRALLARLEALYVAGSRAEGEALAARLRENARSDPDLAFAAGVALSNAQQFERAETLFEIALKADPANFNLLYNTGVAAARAGHPARASEVLEAALRQQPHNVDTLYALACAHYSLRQWESAVQLLSQAAALQPRRADVQKVLALAATDLGALDDASAAWDRYLKFEPNDDDARRERGYTAVQRGHLDEGLVDLEWFVAKHPDDVVGHYELGLAQRSADMVKALAEFDRALALDPNYVPARTARGSLYYQTGKPEDAVKDLEIAAALRPDDPAGLDRLGQTYEALDRTADAIRVLRRAAALAPQDSKTLLHFAHALADAGNTEESKGVMDRFRQLGPEKQTGVRAGFVEYLSLSDPERHADYKARLEKAIREHPQDPALRVDHLKLLLADGEPDKAVQEADAIVDMKPPAAVLADAGRALLTSRNYASAADLLQRARDAGASDDVAANLAIAAHLNQAESLAAADSPMLLQAVDEAVAGAPDRPDLYRDAAILLAAKGRIEDAARLLERAARILPGNRVILLLQAAANDLAGNTAGSEASLSAIRDRWPEWRLAWTVHGMVLSRHGRFEESRKALETAVALGESEPGAYFYLADSTLRTGAPAAAETAIGKALKLAPADPWIAALAGRIALDRKDIAAAIERLRHAVQLRPTWAAPHLDLARAFRADGSAAPAKAEEQEAARLETAGLPAGDPPYLLRWFCAAPDR
jgi:tetratricopeptide (TPR) repeat protein